MPDEEGLRNYVLKSTLNGKSISHYEINYEFYNGKVIPFSLSASPFRDSHNNITGSVLIIRDISNLKEMENNLRHLATHDVLTNLPNRFLFNDRDKQALMRAARYKNYVAFMLMDFDHFKEINDTMGHLVGDRLLREAAERIKKCLREYDTVARMGGDEFIVLVSDLKNEGETGLIAERILSSFKEAFYIDQNKIYFTPSIGISVFPANGDNIETLLKAADMAMYNAKSEGGNRFCYFSSSMKLILEEHSGIKMQLEEALKRREFVLYYQPLIDARMGNIVSAEALIRWKHPKLGLQEPLKFIPVAESTGYIVPIGEWVLSTAFRECKKWNSKGERISVCVNVSFKQLEDEEFVSKVKKTFEKTKLPPEYLIIEITESAAMHQEEMVIKNLEKINEMGIQLIWQTGKNYYEQYKHLAQENIKIMDFIDDMQAAFSACDLVISRAGASAISEIAVLPLPVILVPSPNVAANHQFYNDKSLANKNAAILIEDKNFVNQIVPTLSKVFNNQDIMKELSKNIESFAKPEATNVIAKSVLKFLKI